MKKILPFLFIYTISYAHTEQEVMTFVEKECQFNNPNITTDKKIFCMENIVNCAVTNSGGFDLVKVTKKCLEKKGGLK